MARPDSLGAMPEDEMMMAEGGDMDMGGEIDALVGEVIAAAMPGIETAIRDAINGVLLGGGEEAVPADDMGGGRPAGLA